MNKCSRYPQSVIPAGFITLEILVVCALGTFLILILIQWYGHFSRYDRMLQAWASVQERERFLAHLLRERLQQAGDAHCLGDSLIKQNEAIRGIHSNKMIIGACRFYKKQWQFMHTAYFVDRASRQDHKGHPVFSLYEQPLGEKRVELVSDISRWSVKYGWLKNNEANILSYTFADEVNDWSRVRAVFIRLILKADPLPDQSLYITVSLRERGKCLQ